MNRFTSGTFFRLAGLTIAIADWSAGCQQAPPAATPYTLTGKVVIVNDCVGGVAGIPASVTVAAWVQDANGNQIGSQPTKVPVAAAPTDPPNTKSGDYTVTINIPAPAPGPAFGTPVSWLKFTVKRTNGDPICQIECANPKTHCSDTAQQAATPVAASGPTKAEIRVNCTCGS